MCSDLLNGGVASGDESTGLQGDELDLSDPEAASEEAAGLTDEDEGEAEDADEEEAGLTKRSRPKADEDLLPTEDRYVWQVLRAVKNRQTSLNMSEGCCYMQ